MSAGTVVAPRALRARPAAAVPAAPAVPGRAPLVVLLLLLAITGIVPQEVLVRSSVGGILPSDLLLAGALGWAALDVPWRRLDRRTCWVIGGLVAFMLIVVAQEVRALHLGRSLSGSGGEARVLLALGTFLVALPLVSDAVNRARLGRGLAFLGLLVGLFGIAQPLLGLVFDAPNDIAPTTTQGFTTAGRTVGQFAFPVAVLCGLSALAAGAARTARGRGFLAVVVALNLVALILTFERTFFVVLALGVLVLIAGTPGPARARLVLAVVATLVLVPAGLAVVDPARVAATGKRLASIAHPTSDESVRYRTAEAALVRRHIDRSPWTGEALGATLRIGRPGTTRPLVDRRYSENGYLWLAWKVGIPAAALICLVLVAAMTARGRQRLPDAPGRALAVGAQASLVALAVANLTFPSFSQIAITGVIGVLAACCLTPLRSTR